MANEVFISYSRKNFTKVREIKETLDCEVGIDCWMDLDGIESGEQFEDVIIDAISRHDTILFMKSAQSMESEWALDELDFAKHEKKRIVIVHIDDSEMTKKFYFRYHKYDQIIWDDSIQREKLIRNLKSWFSIDQAKKSTQTNVYPVVPEQEDADFCFLKAQDFYSKKKYSAAMIWFRKAAEQGLASAQNYLGLMFHSGHGVTQDYEVAVRWYRKAAEQGYATAQYNLGFMYKRGLWVTQNYEEAMKWFRKAAEQGDDTSQYELGSMLDYGQGVTQNYEEAVKWYCKAAEQGNKFAVRRLKELGVNN